MSKVLTLITLFAAIAFAYLYQTPLSPSFPNDHDFNTKWDEESCKISRTAAFEVLDGPNEFSTSPSDDINAVKIHPAINKTNWEQWEFDGLSYTGLSFILVTFSRDYAYHFFGKGILRIEFYITLADGTSIQELDYVQESTVIDCPDFTTGIWNSSDRSYSFHTTKDLKHARLEFDSWRINGSYKLSSTTPPHHADGSAYDAKGSNNKNATEISPGLFYSVPVAGGAVEVEASMPSGRHIGFKGRGGSTRLWAKDSWIKVSESWLAIRAWAGPYTFTYWDVISRVDDGVKYFSAHLFYNDELLVGTQVGNVSDNDDYVLMTTNFDGELAGRFQDKNTGHSFEFGSPTRGKKWSFEMQQIGRAHV